MAGSNKKQSADWTTATMCLVVHLYAQQTFAI